MVKEIYKKKKRTKIPPRRKFTPKLATIHQNEYEDPILIDFKEKQKKDSKLYNYLFNILSKSLKETNDSGSLKKQKENIIIECLKKIIPQSPSTMQHIDNQSKKLMKLSSHSITLTHLKEIRKMLSDVSKVQEEYPIFTTLNEKKVKDLKIYEYLYSTLIKHLEHPSQQKKQNIILECFRNIIAQSPFSEYTKKEMDNRCYHFFKLPPNYKLTVHDLETILKVVSSPKRKFTPTEKLKVDMLHERK
jgi:hypothetical protein